MGTYHRKRAQDSAEGPALALCVYATCNPLSSLQSPGFWAKRGLWVCVCVASEVSPYGQWMGTTDTISVAVTSSSCKTVWLFLALLQSGVMPWRRGSAHTVTEWLQCKLTVLDGRLQPCHSQHRPTLWELPPLPFFSRSGPAPGRRAPLHLTRARVAEAKIHPATPNWTSAHREQVILLCLSFSKYLGKSNILSNRNEK